MFSLHLLGFSLSAPASSHQSKIMLLWLICDSKLAVGVNMSVYGCLSVCVTVMNREICPGCALPLGQ